MALRIVEIKFDSYYKHRFLFRVTAQDEQSQKYYQWYWTYIADDVYRYDPSEDEYYGHGKPPPVEFYRQEHATELTEVRPVTKTYVDYCAL